MDSTVPKGSQVLDTCQSPPVRICISIDPAGDTKGPRVLIMRFQGAWNPDPNSRLYSPSSAQPEWQTRAGHLAGHLLWAVGVCRMNAGELRSGSQEAIVDWVPVSDSPCDCHCRVSVSWAGCEVGPCLLPGALGGFSHSPRCLGEEMGTGWNWESVLTGLDSLSDRFSNSSYSLQVGTLGARGVRVAPAQSDPATGLWVPTPRLPCWSPSAGSDPKLTSSSACPGKESPRASM